MPRSRRRRHWKRPAAAVAAAESEAAAPKRSVREVFAEFRKHIEKSNVSMQSVYLMLASQVLMIGLAVYERWPLANVLLLYWSQNIVIGVFTLLRLLSWKNIVFEDESDLTVREREIGRYVAAFIFSFSFFVTHALILWQLADVGDAFGTDGPGTFRAIRGALIVFTIGQTASFVLNYRVDSATRSTYNEIFNNAFILILPLLLWFSICATVVIVVVFVMFAAFFAGVPEHILTAVSDPLGGALPALALIVFMALKALMDMAAQMASYSEKPVRVAD